MEDILLIGYGGHAKVVTDTIDNSGQYRIAGYVEKNSLVEGAYRGRGVIGSDCDLQEIYNKGIHNAFISIGFMGNSELRRKLYERLKRIGYILPVIVDESAVIAEDAVIEEGTYVGKNAVVNANACVGKMCIINTAAIVEHDCSIGDFSHIAVGSVLCGNVSISEDVFVGANATLIQGTSVGKNSIIGAGAIVLRNVACNQTVYGVWR